MIVNCRMQMVVVSAEKELVCHEMGFLRIKT